MPAPIVLAVCAAACFLGLAHAAVTMPERPFRIITVTAIVFGAVLALVSPGAGLAVVAPAVFARRLAAPRIPATVPAEFFQEQR